MQIKKISIEKLSNDPANARKHDDRNIDAIVGSLRRFGQQKPIVVDVSGVVRAGNGTLEAARRLGWKDIDCVETQLKGSDAIAYAIADNRTAELADWDDDVLAAQLNGLLADDPDLLNAAGFSEEDLAGLLGDLDGDGTTGEVEEDEVPEVPVEPITKPGDLWILGKHRLLCGDSTKDSDVKRLMAGNEINIAFTSPPYASQRKYDESSGFKPIPPDMFVDWFKPIAENVKKHLAKDGSWFVNIKEHCEDGQRSLYVKDLTLAHVREWKWLFVDEFVWKRGGVPGKWSNRFKNQWEPIFHFTQNKEIKLRHANVMHASSGAFEYSPDNPKSKTGFFSNKGRDDIAKEGMALPGNVLEIGTEVKQTEVHSAPFPVALPTFFIKAFSDEDDNIYEPFCGSGTTLIAAEQLSRKCYGMEISPQYCDVIVKRWENLTGEKAVCQSATPA